MSKVLGDFNFPFYTYFLSWSVWQTYVLHLIIPPSEVLVLSMLWHPLFCLCHTLFPSFVMFSCVVMVYRSLTGRNSRPVFEMACFSENYLIILPDICGTRGSWPTLTNSCFEVLGISRILSIGSNIKEGEIILLNSVLFQDWRCAVSS